MRISNLTALRVGAVALLLALSAQATLARDGRTPHFASADDAYRQALGSWRGGYVEQAIPAFRFAAGKGNFLAKFYLARILSDSGTPYTDHPAAYRIYNEMARAYINVDPDDDRRAPFVARALSALARYVKDGLPEIGVKPDPARAAEFLRHAAQFFNDEDAQFELAKLYLTGEGVPKDPQVAMHWLSVPTQRGHAGAQAFLADIYWRGLQWRDAGGRKHVIRRDPLRAFALISVAVEHAPDRDRIWIEDIYQNIFCGASSGTRFQAQGMVADWRKKYGRNLPQPSVGIGPLAPKAVRSCSNGESVPPPLVRYEEASPMRPAAGPRVMQGGMLGNGVMGVGASRR